MEKRLTIRLDRHDYDAVIAQATICGVTASEYVRRRVLGHNVVPTLQKCDIQTIAVLRQLGGLIKQIYAREIVDPDKTFQILEEIKKTIKYIREK